MPKLWLHTSKKVAERLGNSESGARPFALVDPKRYAEFAQYRWYLGRSGYAYRIDTSTGRPRYLKLHLEVYGPVPRGRVVDHKNRNPLDCRRRNLRALTPSQSQWNTGKRRDNTSGYKGVSKFGGAYVARIRTHNEHHHLGRYQNPTHAAIAYDAAARVLRGRFAVLNFPHGVPRDP